MGWKKKRQEMKGKKKRGGWNKKNGHAVPIMPFIIFNIQKRRWEITYGDYG